MNKMPRRALVATAATAFVASLGVGTAIPAQASPAPSCVYINTSDNSREAYAHNLCSTVQRVKFKWQYATDGSCFSLAAKVDGSDGGTHRGSVTYPGRFAGAESC